MNILVISNVAWDDKNSSGNTYSNLFENWENTNFHSMYSREQLPDNSCCSTYYCASPFDLIKNLFTPWRIGREFKSTDINQQHTLSQSEEIIKNRHDGFIKRTSYLLVDLFYLSGFWINKKAKQYIKKCNPDIIVMTGVAEAFRYKLAQYIKENYRAKLVTYIVDDTYNTEKSSKTFLGWLRSKRYKRIFEMSDKVYGISQQMCDAYSKEFGCEVTLLHKGCELCAPKTCVNKPIEIVYAGNLMYGRDDILGKLALSLQSINTSEIKAVLRIYTGTTITDDIDSKLNLGESSQIAGAKPYDDIKKIMKHADVVLHVESFEPDQMQLVRYSFSTKITDCMQSGSVMMAIGPSGIASIEYSKQIPGSIVVDDLNKLEYELKGIVDNPESLVGRAKMINDYAKTHFEIGMVRSRLQNEIKLLVNGKS